MQIFHPRTVGGRPAFRMSFFDNPEQAHRVLLEIRDEVSSDPEMEWTVMNLEKVETVPVSQTNILALLNEGVGSFIQKYEIIDRVGPK